MLKIAPLFFICLVIIILVPQVAKAEISYLDCYAQNNCGMCDALAVATKIAKFILGVSGSLALLFFVIAGLTLILSQGSAGKIDAAKRLMLGTLIGIAIVYLAWVGVNFIIYNFTGAAEKDQGMARIFNKSWIEFKCVKPEELVYTKGEPVKPPLPIITACKSTWEVGNEQSCGGDCVGFQLVTNNPQCPDASPALVEFLTCFAKKLGDTPLRYYPLTKDKIILTSISDDNGLKRCRENYLKPPCFHKQNSCHYGHGETNGSYAIDVRSRGLSESDITQFNVLVNDCSGEYFDETYVVGAPHLHASAGACTGR